MGKFFNHYKSDRAVSLAHPFNERSANPGTTLGIGLNLDVERHVGRNSSATPELPILFDAATFKATIKRKRCENAKSTLYFSFRHSFRMLAGMRTPSPAKSAISRRFRAMIADEHPVSVTSTVTVLSSRSL